MLGVTKAMSMLVLLGQLSTALHAQASEPPRLALRGHVPSCLTLDALRTRVAALSVAQQPGADTAVQFELRLDGLRSAELWLLRSGARFARRHFERLPADCHELRETLAVSIALTLEHMLIDPELVPELRSVARRPRSAARRARAADPGRVLGASSSAAGQGAQGAAEPEGAPAPPLAAKPSSERGGAVEHDRTPAPAQLPAQRAGAPWVDAETLPPSAAGTVEVARWLVDVHAGARVVVGTLPDPALAAGLGVALRRASWELRGGVLISARADHALAGGTARTSVWGGELLGCRSESLAPVALHGCLGVLMGAYTANGIHYAESWSASALWSALAGQVGVRWPSVSPLSLRLALQAQLNTQRPTLEVVGSPERLHQQTLGGAAVLDLVSTWP